MQSGKPNQHIAPARIQTGVPEVGRQGKKPLCQGAIQFTLILKKQKKNSKYVTNQQTR